MTTFDFVCHRCGRGFNAAHPRAKWCSDGCRQAAYRTRLRDDARAWRLRRSLTDSGPEGRPLMPQPIDPRAAGFAAVYAATRGLQHDLAFALLVTAQKRQDDGSAVFPGDLVREADYLRALYDQETELEAMLRVEAAFAE